MLFQPFFGSRSAAKQRPAIVLLVVIAMLTIFAAAAVAFVFYANAEATSSKYFREGTVTFQPDADPEQIFGLFLQQLLCGVKDDETGVYSAMRGWDLFRNTYGLNYAIGPITIPGGAVVPAGAVLVGDPNAPVTKNTMGNTVPFIGTGRLHYTYPPTAPYLALRKQQDVNLINYTYYPPGYWPSSTSSKPGIPPQDGFLRDPERLGYRSKSPRPGFVGDWNDSPTGSPRGQYFRSANPSYTYPDLNNMFLAAVRADGTVLMPSFHRHWLFNPTTTLDNSTLNPNWTNVLGKYMILRPRPQENPGFPYPESPGGDVQNLIGGPGYYDPITQKLYPHDSIWMSLGAPVFKAPDGRKYTFLFAPLIVDLDGKINLNAAGNIKGIGNTHVSNMGLGTSEISLAEVMNGDAVGTGLGTEWTRLFLGFPVTIAPKTTYLQKMGRYGPDGKPYDPKNLAVAAPGTPSHFYAMLDVDAMRSTGAPSLPIPLPASTNCFPKFGTTTPITTPTFTGYDDGSVLERTTLPLLYNLLDPTWLSAAKFNRRFAPSNMEMLLRYGGTGTEAFTSELALFCPTNFANPAIRGRVTTDSWDLHAPGFTPWIWQPPGTQLYQISAPPWPATGPLPPTGAAFLPSPVPAGLPGIKPTPLGKPTDFDPNDWSGVAAALGRLDLNRPLPRYPTPAANGRITDLTGYAIAQDARQQFAADIFKCLCAATGAGNPTDTFLVGGTVVYVNTPPNLTSTTLPKGAPPYNQQTWYAFRYLAQLAANIVDYIDNDDYMTRFQWYTPPTSGGYASAAPEWVFGTELPRVLINEVYIGYDSTKKTANVYVELHNPFSTDLTMGKLMSGTSDVGSDSDNGAARLEMPPSTAGGTDNYGIYELLVTHNLLVPPGKTTENPNWQDPANVTGDPTYKAPLGAMFVYNSPSAKDPKGQPIPGLTVWHTSPPPKTLPTWLEQIPAVPPGKAALDTRFIYPSNGMAGTLPPKGAISGWNRGYYVVGPTPTIPGTKTPVSFQSPDMTFSIPGTTLKTASVVLRRLACPRLPYDNNPTLALPGNPPNPLYNPYITVDCSQLGNGFPNNTGASSGRTQPYVATNMPSQTSTAKTPPSPVQSFFQANTPLVTPFTWLVHLDRQLISPMELLHVSGVPPYQLTNNFLGGTPLTPGKYQHYAPWTDPAARLYRAFELFGTRSLAAGFLANDPSRFLNIQTNITVTPGTATAPAPLTAVTVTPLNPTTGLPALTGISASGVSWAINAGDTLVILDSSGTNENVVVTKTDPLLRTFTANFRQSHLKKNTQILLTTLNDRMPGKVNINTIWDPEIFRALCPPSPSINMVGAGANRTLLVDNMFYNPPAPPKPGATPIQVTLLDSRSPKSRAMTDPLYWSQPYIPGPTDFSVPPTPGIPGSGYKQNHPFRGWAIGTTPASANDTLFPGGVGINDTLFRLGSGVPATGAIAPLLFSVPGGPPNPGVKHPYQMDQVLTSLFNNVTTRSNVFAVWVTIGCFEVTDDTVRPVKLGAEIGRAQGTNVRHQMFAIVDRSKLIATTTTSQTAVTANAVPKPLTPVSMAGIQVGSLITLDLNLAGNAETVLVTGINTNAAGTPISFNAVFTKNHVANGQLIVYGAPGPMAYTPPSAVGVAPVMTNTFNPHAHPAVLYFSIIN